MTVGATDLSGRLVGWTEARRRKSSGDPIPDYTLRRGYGISQTPL